MPRAHFQIRPAPAVRAHNKIQNWNIEAPEKSGAFFYVNALDCKRGGCPPSKGNSARKIHAPLQEILRSGMEGVNKDLRPQVQKFLMRGKLDGLYPGLFAALLIAVFDLTRSPLSFDDCLVL